ncbi:MAG: GNAT family N-acetyltransferase [Candidatus Kariarchaeaceae archaeon]
MKHHITTRTVPFDNSDLTLKVAQTEEEIIKIAAFNVEIHEEGIDKLIFSLFRDHPTKEELIWYYLEDDTGKIVSALTLLPFEWQLDGITFPICEMGFVGTLEEYRGKGLVNIMNDLYEQEIKKKKYLLSALRGIPYYYRRFKYEFVFPLDSRILLNTDKIPDTNLADITIRKATTNDLPEIKHLYEALTNELCYSTAFDSEAFGFRYINEAHDEFKFTTYLIYEKETIGYFVIGDPYGSGLAEIVQVSNLSMNQMIKILQFVKEQNEKLILEKENSKEEESEKEQKIILSMNNSLEFGQFIVSLGGKANDPWRWQVMIPSIVDFLVKISPALEKRIEESNFKGLTQKIKISNYKEVIELDFVNGKIVNIDSVKGFPDGTVDLRVPGLLLNKVILSDNKPEEIKQIMTDVLIKAETKDVISVIFPKRKSFIHSYY